MQYSERLQNVSVLGAAGKMGSGILLLTAFEMAEQMLKPENKNKTFVLNAIDTSEEGLKGLLQYVELQTSKEAEKKIQHLQDLYSKNSNNIIENNEVVKAYVEDVMRIINPTTKMESAYNSYLIFEAVSENQSLKEKLFTQIDTNNTNKPWFFTNTSSVPIGLLNNNTKLNGRILGFHFYNPPAIQKLVELITIPDNTHEMVEFAKQYAANLRKIVVPSNDIAGFVGNGHFMRDALYGIKLVENLAEQMPLYQAIYCVDKVTRDFLGRPMGIFQLIDYVGIDVVQFILRVMQLHIKDELLHSTLLDELVLIGVKGGQFSDGSQKEGFFSYEKGKPIANFDKQTHQYIQFSDFASKCDEWLGEIPSEMLPWKQLIKIEDKASIMIPAFKTMENMQTPGCKLALDFAKNSREIAKKLVADGVAHNDNDVNTVLLTGFFHAYGPINQYL